MMKNSITDVLKEFGCTAVVFDLDGTMLDNNPFHLRSWKEYLKRIGREMSDEEYNENINGRTNRDVVKYIYGDVSEEELWKYTNEKEALYRELYAPHIKAVAGLEDMLARLHEAGVPMAIATSGIKVNIDFMFENIPIRKYFMAIVDSSAITHGKPHPEIFEKAAEAIKTDPTKCLAFEDSVVGIQSAQAAGMKVIAVSTTHPMHELEIADRIINDFSEL